MSPIAFGVSDCPPPIRRPIWFGGPGFGRCCCCHSDRIWLCFSGVTVPPRWRLVLGFADACLCLCSRTLLGRFLCLSSFASRFDTCFRFSFLFFSISIDRRLSVRKAGLAAAGTGGCVYSRPDRIARSSLTWRALRMPCPRSG